MTDNKSPKNEYPRLNQQELTIESDLKAYHRRLGGCITDSAERISSINRELQRRQQLLQAAMAIEQTQNDKLTAAQQKLNELEEQNRQAMLQYMTAKQQLDRLMQDYNHQLEYIKQLHSDQDSEAAAMTQQKQDIQGILQEWQKQNFFLQKQQNLIQEVENRLAAGERQIAADLPPIEELQPKEPQNKTGQPAAKAPHANAGFWDNSRHTALNPEKIGQSTADRTSESDTEAAPAKRKSSGNTIMSYILCIALAVAAAFAIRTWVIVPTHVSGSSMQPTLQSNDKILTSPLPYILGEPQHGDVIVFPAPDTAEEESVYYVKRIIAMPGDHLEIAGGNVYINEELLDEDYLLESYTGGYIDTLVPEGCLFVMGDNRRVSHDSRDDNVSFIDIDSVRGKALWRIYPLEEIGSIH